MEKVGRENEMNKKMANNTTNNTKLKQKKD